MFGKIRDQVSDFAAPAAPTTQGELSAMLGVPAPKVAMTQAALRAANELTFGPRVVAVAHR